MNAKKLLYPLVGSVSATLIGAAFGQGAFQNLDFENGTFVSVGGDPYIVEAGPALAGWTAYIGTNEIDRILHNNVSLSTTTIAIFGPGANTFHGQYALLLQNSFPPVLSERPSIAQTATIPASAQSMFFLSSQSYGGIGVSFEGQGIGLSLLEDLGNSQFSWGADISPFAGQTGSLRFFGEGFLDFIQFSNQPIPEPSTVALFGVGALLLSWRMRRKHKRCIRRE